MTTCAYNELYLPLVQRIMGDMYDYAVNTLQYKLGEYHDMFMISGMAYQFEIGNPTYCAGKNGCEIAREVIMSCTDRQIDAADEMYVDKSMEYWIGWSLAYFQWISCIPYRKINSSVPIETMYGMYDTLHEADVSLFVEILNEKIRDNADESMLKRLRQYAGMSQRMLSEKSGVPLRQIQLFEQGRRDIRKTQGTTLLNLSRTLGCRMEDLI
ncbi:MAG: helix-turn-helix domain-containing protein [Lachnospiraceae bacterium]|nr:helix-turn-helix domain-containing protein [Lachnospiraceae bacterium]